MHLFTRSGVTPGQTRSPSWAAFKEPGFLPVLFPKTQDCGSACGVLANLPTEKGISLPFSGSKARCKAEHVYQEEKWLLSRLSNSGLCPSAPFVMAGEVHLCPTQCFHKKARFQVFIWTSVTLGLGGLGVEDVCIVWALGGGVGNSKYRGHRKSWDSVWRSQSACSSTQWLKALKVSRIGTKVSSVAHLPLTVL